MATKSLAGISIDIKVIQGRNLVPKDKNLLGQRTGSDPYVKIMLVDATKQQGNSKYLGRTAFKSRTLAPVWNESYHYDLGPVNARPILQEKLFLQLLIYDNDALTEDDFMGLVTIPLHSEENTNDAKWYPVEKGTGPLHCRNATGELELSVSVLAKRVLNLVRGNVHAMSHHENIHVGLSWNMERGKEIDLDASCVAISKSGEILMKDTVYYGNLANTNRSIYHSGDEMTGETLGDDEVITCHLQQVPHHIAALYFILTAVTPGKTLKDITSANVRFFDKDTSKPICNFKPSTIGTEESTAMFLVRLSRDHDGAWQLSPIEGCEKVARDFGTLIPQIKSYSRDLIPDIRINPFERVAVMRKNGVIRIRDYTDGKQIPEWVSFGLAWDITDGRAIDLDASAICLKADLSPFEIIYFKHLQSNDTFIQHSGDQRSGASSGDDETIKFSLDNVNPEIKYIGIVVNSFSGQELDDVSRAACHLYNPDDGSDIATYALSNAKELDKHTALIMGCLYRSNDDGEWLLRIISEPAQGRTAEENWDELQAFLLRNPPMEPNIITQSEEEEEIDLSMPPVVPHDEEEIVVGPISSI